jgi:hypothetical protein
MGSILAPRKGTLRMSAGGWNLGRGMSIVYSRVERRGAGAGFLPRYGREDWSKDEVGMVRAYYSG